MSTQENINRTGQKYIDGLRSTRTQLWKQACEFDSIPVDSKFVVFSKDNKFAEFYNLSCLRLSEAIAQYRAGGYVGLKIGR